MVQSTFPSGIFKELDFLVWSVFQIWRLSCCKTIMHYPYLIFFMMVLNIIIMSSEVDISSYVASREYFCLAVMSV